MDEWRVTMTLTKKLLKFANDNHHYIIAGIVIAICIFWTYGCESQVNSILSPNQRINRAELQIEVDYFLAHAELKTLDLNRQDEIKQSLLDLGSTFATTGTLNPSGLLNTAVSVAAIAFGLNQRKKRLNNG